jgi:hypothetical protein
MMYFCLIVIIHIIVTNIVRINTTVSKLLKDESESNNISGLFSARIVGIFVADSELPYTLELAKPSIEIAIEKVILNFKFIKK